MWSNFSQFLDILSLLSLDVSVPESAPMEEGRDGAEKSVHPDDDQGDEGGGGGRQRELTVLRWYF